MVQQNNKSAPRFYFHLTKFALARCNGNRLEMFATLFLLFSIVVFTIQSTDSNLKLRVYIWIVVIDVPRDKNMYTVSFELGFFSSLITVTLKRFRCVYFCCCLLLFFFSDRFHTRTNLPNFCYLLSSRSANWKKWKSSALNEQQFHIECFCCQSQGKMRVKSLELTAKKNLITNKCCFNASAVVVAVVVGCLPESFSFINLEKSLCHLTKPDSKLFNFEKWRIKKIRHNSLN